MAAGYSLQAQREPRAGRIAQAPPFIASWPGKIEAGSETDHISAFWDAMPTLCEIAGVTPPEDIDGISYLPTLLQQGDQKNHDYLYWEYDGQQAVRLGKWKAIRSLGKNQMHMKLFNLNEGLREEQNVADAKPGIHKGKLIVRAANMKPVVIDVAIDVIGMTLPPASEWSYHLDLWQHPWAIARAVPIQRWRMSSAARRGRGPRPAGQPGGGPLG